MRRERLAWLNPVLEQDVRGLPISVRALADQSFQRGVADEVDGRLPLQTEALRREVGSNLGPRERPAARQRLPQRTDSADGRVLVQAQVRPPPAAASREHRAEQWEHPGQILGRQQVQRAAHSPGPHDRALLHPRPIHVSRQEIGCPRPHRQRCRGYVLCLNAAEGARNAGDVRNRIGLCGYKPLRAEAQQTDLVCSERGPHGNDGDDSRNSRPRAVSMQAPERRGAGCPHPAPRLSEPFRLTQPARG